MTNRQPIAKSLFTVLLAAVFATASVVPPAVADPPPWAPAHGYRAKKGHKKHYKKKHYKKKHYRKKHRGAYESADIPPTFGIDLGNCNRQLLGQALGAAAGAAIGSQVGKGDGRTAAIVGGSIIGLIVGGSIGRAMDQVDHNCIGQALERAETGQPVAWHNADTGARYQITPTRTYKESDGRYCREYWTEGIIDGRVQELYGTACRQPDGSWQVAQ
jgi:surface antigen